MIEKNKKYSNESFSKITTDNISQVISDAVSGAQFSENTTVISNKQNTKWICIDGYMYEPSYEWFSGTALIYDNTGRVIYNKDADCIDNYVNAEYHCGECHSFEDAAKIISDYFDKSDVCQMTNYSGLDRNNFKKNLNIKPKYGPKVWENPEKVARVRSKYNKKSTISKSISTQKETSNAQSLPTQYEQDLMKQGYRRLAYKPVDFTLKAPDGNMIYSVDFINAYDLNPDDGLSMTMTALLHPRSTKNGSTYGSLWVSKDNYEKLSNSTLFNKKNGYGVVYAKTKLDKSSNVNDFYPTLEIIDYSVPFKKPETPFDLNAHNENFKPRQNRVLTMLQSVHNQATSQMSEDDLVDNGYTRLLWKDSGKYKDLHKVEFIRACDMGVSTDPQDRVYNPYVITKKTKGSRETHAQYISDMNYNLLLQNSSSVNTPEYNGLFYGKLTLSSDKKGLIVSFSFNPYQPVISAKTPFDINAHQKYLNESKNQLSMIRQLRATELSDDIENKNQNEKTFGE